MAGTGGTKWNRNLPPWHWIVRVVAAFVLLDQATGLTQIPSSEGIVIACLGAMFAPMPKEKR